MKFYCLKEKKHVEIQDSLVTYKILTTRNGKKRKQAIAKCPDCKARLSKFVKNI